MNTHKIGSIQAIALICIVMINHIIINLPETIIQSTGSSAWINVIYISTIAIVFAFLVCKLFEKFSGKDILDIAQYVGGKWLKFIIGIAFIGLFILISSTILRYFSSALNIMYFPKTPIYILVSIFLLATIIANKIGFKAISKINLLIVVIRPI